MFPVSAFPSLLILAAVLGAQPDDLGMKSRRAKELMSTGRYAEAIPIYQELVKAVPNEPRLVLNLGLAQQMAGDCRSAVRQFEAAAKMEPGLFPAWVSLGGCYLDLGEPAKAIVPLEKAVALEPRHAMARRALGDALFTTGRFEQAARRLSELGEMEPSDPGVWYGLGKSYEALSQQAFQRLEKAGRGSAWWLAMSGEIRLSHKQYTSAFAMYRDALAKMPNMPGVNAALAEIYRNTGHPEWAAAADKKEQELPPPNCAAARQECAFRAGRHLEAATATQPLTLESHYWQARAYGVLASQAFERLRQLPPSVELHRVRAEDAGARGSHIEAVKELRAALKLAPDHPQVALELAAALHAANDREAALALVGELLKRDPDSDLLNFMYGDTLLRMEQAEKAVPYLEKAARQRAGEQTHASLGQAYARTGQLERALPHLKAGAGIDFDGRIHFQLARAYQAAGERELARQAMQKYQELQRQSETARQPEITPPE